MMDNKDSTESFFPKSKRWLNKFIESELGISIARQYELAFLAWWATKEIEWAVAQGILAAEPLLELKRSLKKHFGWIELGRIWQVKAEDSFRDGEEPDAISQLSRAIRKTEIEPSHLRKLLRSREKLNVIARRISRAKNPENPSWLLSVRDIRDWPGLCTKLSHDKDQDAPNPGKGIWERLSPEVQAPIECAATGVGLSEEDRSNTIEALNDLLERRDLYQAQDYLGTDLPQRARKLLRRNRDKLPASDVQELNRLLIETAYPHEIAKIHPVSIPEDNPWKIKADATEQAEALIKTLHCQRRCMRANDDQVGIVFFRLFAELVAWVDEHPELFRQGATSFIRGFGKKPGEGWILMAGLILKVQDRYQRFIDQQQEFLPPNEEGRETEAA